ncbi:MAG: carbon monoxide dehydrogenase subunit G [Anaerolineales bacterium]|nr:carbon monoxide dehydrogenase subunit G [Anaerolineales bacterium]
MKLEGTYTFEAPREVVWEALLDPNVLASVMPGCERLEQVGDNEYKGALKIRVGPVQGAFEGLVNLSDINTPESYRMQVDGKGAPGFMKGVGEVRLEDQGASTLMRYSGEAQVGGRIASVGQRLLDSSAKALTRQSLDGLHEQIKARLQANATHHAEEALLGEPSPPSPVAVPSQTEFALGVAKHLVDDLVPAPQRPKLVAGALVFLASLVVLNWWMNAIARKVAREVWERRDY